MEINVNSKLQDLLDLPALQELLDSLNEACGFTTAIIDCQGNVLTASGWQEVCAQFHRLHPVTREFCRQSDCHILEHIDRGERSASYRCPMGLIDSATAIVIDGEHLGNAFIGQLFLEKPDLDYFRSQALTYGFEEKGYLDAISRVPVWSSDKLAKSLSFLGKFAQMLAVIGVSTLKEKQAAEALHLHRESLEREVAQRTAQLLGTKLRLQEEIVEHRQAEEDLQEQTAALEEEIAQRQQIQEALLAQADTLEAEIAERRQAQEALSRNTHFLNTIIETQPECVKMLDRDGKLLMMNRSGLGMIEADSFPQVEGRCVYPLIAERYRDSFRALTDEAFQGRSGSLEFEITGLKGRQLWLDTQAVPFRDEAGKVVAQLCITRNITEHKALEAQLFQAQKMEAIGHLAGGISHDFNNILTAIIGFANLMDMRMAEGDPQRLNLRHILTSAERAADLTRSLLAFSRKQIIDPQPADLNKLIARAESFLQRIMGEDIDLTSRLFDQALTVCVDCGQIEQVLMNLVSNARDAMPDGGMLSISTEQVQIDASFIKAHGYGKPGSYALLNISDSGMGMSAVDCKRVFEPFFTTKEAGKGTGLGMSVVYGIVKQHSGYINVYSEPGVGTAFTIYLPLVATAPEEKPGAVHGVELPRGQGETILVADDDALLRELTEHVLGEFGYRVVTAEDGEQAIAKFREADPPIDLVILDIIMPRLNGKEALQEIRRISPGCKALLVSGYAADIIQRRGGLEAGVELLSKPLRPQLLLKKVREILDAR